MLQVTKGLTTKLFIPVDYINNVDGEKTRDAFAWDAGDEILIYLKHKKTLLGYEATTSESGAIEFELNGDEDFNKYDVTIIFTRGGKSFNCYVGTLQIVDKATPDFNTLNGVYIYADDDTIKFIKAYDGERKASIAELNAALEQAQQNGGGGGVAELCVKTTYAELRALRDSGKLVAGLSYRITDYTTTTVQENTSAAGNDFDVIVTALGANTLSEDARATQRAEDAYFNGSNLAAWRLRYCLDNDVNRFAWADTENGKGVIFRLVDEWQNNCPYDFKNIMFKRYFDEDAGCYKKGENDNNKWCYTFCMLDFYDNKAHDVTVEQEKYISDENLYYHNYNNVILPYLSEDSLIKEEAPTKGRYTLNDNVFVTDTYICSISEDYLYGEFYGCYSNTFGNGCYSNTFGNDCSSNMFGNGCYSNTFGNNCSFNTFGNGCSFNTFGNGCYSNTFGNGCSSNMFGNGCSSNMFGNNCSSNMFGNGCYSNTFGNGCSSNMFGNDCYSNTFGDKCYSVTFGNNLVPQNYTRYITIMSGVKNVFIICSQALSDSALCQNVLVNSGVAGESITNRKILTVATANNAFLTTFGTASDVVINV